MKITENIFARAVHDCVGLPSPPTRQMIVTGTAKSSSSSVCSASRYSRVSTQAFESS